MVDPCNFLAKNIFALFHASNAIILISKADIETIIILNK